MQKSIDAKYLHIRKAFDRVWHDSLFYKFAKCSIDKTILKILMNLYTDMENCVRTHSQKSSWFPILINTNKLLWELKGSGLE